MAISTTDVTVWGGGLVTLAGVLGFLWRKVWPVARRFSHFLDDFLGEKSRPGVPARPGVLERLQSVEDALADIRYHVQPNGGGSAHDRLLATIRAVQGELRDHVAESSHSHRAIHARIDALKEERGVAD